MNAPVHRHFAAAMAIAAALALGACQNAKVGDDLATSSLQSASIKETAKAGQAWEKDTGDVKLGLAYAQRLESIGQTDRRLEVLKVLAERNPKDAGVRALYGKELARNGMGGEAETVLSGVVAQGTNDPRIYSALGSAMDQQGRYADARTQYQKALALKPGDPGVLNNLGMSYALDGDLKKAEETLRQASSQPGAQAQPRIRQNLALVVGLSGRFDEAREIASRDLPPAEVDANLAYLQKMLAQPDPWKELKQGQG